MAEKKKKKTIETAEPQEKPVDTPAEEETVQPTAEAETMEEAVAEENDLQMRLNTLEAELDAAKAATEDAQAKLLRMQADFDNFRRRQREESERTVAQAAASVVADLLPVLDNFERALAAMEQTAEKDGVEMIAKQLLSVLTNAGLEEIEALGADFDPNLHQAVMQTEAGEENKNKVTMVLQRGYTLKGKLLRPVMVQVGM